MENKTALITGAGGFLGSHMSKYLVSQHFKVLTLGRKKDNTYVCDLSSSEPEFNEKFDVLIHNAGKAHAVPKNEKQSRDFFDINVTGTRNLLSAVERMEKKPSSIIFISTIAVYGKSEGQNVKEDALLLADDPYGKSKIMAEELLLSWCATHDVSLTVLRLPLVVGRNAPGNLGKMVTAIQRGRYVRVAGGASRKSMVLAEDIARVLPTAARTPGTFNLTDGYHPSFAEVEDKLMGELGVKKIRNLPYPIARLIAMAGDVIDFVLPGRSPVTSRQLQKIVSTLTFDDSRARTELAWKPRRILDVPLV